MAQPTFSQSASSNAAWSQGRILFEDEWLIAIDKPAGLPTQPTLDAARPSVFSEVKKFLQRRDGREPYLALHHRLDRDTTGVLLLSKNQKANAGVGALFAGKVAQKTYQALALLGTGCPDSWEVKNYLGVIGRVAKANKFGAVRSGGDPAHTSFRELERFHDVVLIEAKPHTGRTHQIRVHLTECGHPILGDELYGGPVSVRLGSGAQLRFQRVMLHAASLAFVHPMTKAEVAIACPLPEDFALSLDRLR
ncbi:MAG: RluA family pseudouridine synthase [Nibricoccus sp.]